MMGMPRNALFAAALCWLAPLPSAAQTRAPLACPGPGPLVLSSGVWDLTTPCPVASVTLSGTADLRVIGSRFQVDGPISLIGDASLTIETTQFVLAQHATAQYPITLRDRSLFAVDGAAVITSGVPEASHTAFLYAFGDAQVRITNSTLDTRNSWFLAYMNERARLRVDDGAAVPTEIYPRDAATVEIAGPLTSTRTVLLIPPHASATIEDLPGTDRYTHRFGRGEPGYSGIDYLVDVQDSRSRIGVSVGPYTDVMLRNNDRPVTLSYLFVADPEPSWLAGLRSGTWVTQTLEHQGRHLALEATELYDIGWQIYLQRIGGTTAPVVSIDDAWVNELGALADSRAEARDTVFQFAYLSAFEHGSRVRVEDSVVNSQNVRASDDGVVEIFESQIWGSLLDASGSARLRLTNVELHPNVCHATCLPACLSAGNQAECNSYNPAPDVLFDARDAAAILGARLAPIPAPVAAAAALDLVGDVYVASPVAALAGYDWELTVTKDGGTPIAVASGVGGMQRDALLGTVGGAQLSSGDWSARLELRAPGETPLVAERFFRVLAP